MKASFAAPRSSQARRRQTGSEREAGVTRCELLGTVFALMVVASVALPALANTKPRADRLSCMNNLRLIGRAYHLWANDHRDLMPWLVDVSEGGTRGYVLRQNVWFHFGAMSNELVTPSLLACPSDTQRAARDFSNAPSGGFFNPGYQNNAVSYFVGVHASLGLPAESYAYYLTDNSLGGDRNLQTGSRGSCSLGFSRVAAVPSPATAVHWTDAIHRFSGNVLLVDGRVLQTSNARVGETLLWPRVGGDLAHLLLP